MIFSSIPFLYYFLPCVLFLYLIAPRCLKNTVLLLSSLIFYAWGEPRYVILMVVSIALGYVFGLLIEKFRGHPRLSKAMMVISVVISIGLLGYFKYADFFLSNWNALTGMSVPLLRIALPIGISFYTFQILSYTIDVWRGEVTAQKNPIHLATYVALFPQLIAGPIVRYSDIAAQLVSRKHTIDGIVQGGRRFVWGLSKKILIANVLGELCDIFKASEDKTVLFFWLYAIAYTLHIYFDFSGYSDMAIGLGRLFGFDFPENFNYPYISSSITEFWRRWHISLSTWFRDYVYIPLGGNRVGKARWFLNLSIVWMLTGFWHGAAWNFVIWGGYFAVFLILEKVCFGKWLKKMRVLSHAYVLLLVVVSMVIFDASSMGQAFSYLGAMFGGGGYALASGTFRYYLRSYGGVLLIALIGSTPIPKLAMQWMERQRPGGAVLAWTEPIAMVLLLLVCTAYLVNGSFNPFLYFRF